MSKVRQADSEEILKPVFVEWKELQTEKNILLHLMKANVKRENKLIDKIAEVREMYKEQNED